MARVVVRWWQRIEWTRAKAPVVVVAFLHLVGAYTLVFAPDNQLFTQGTRPVFALFPTTVWAVAFLLAGLSACSLLLRVTAARQVLTWSTVIPTQLIWTAAAVFAVRSGEGSAMGVVFLLAVLAFTSIAALFMAVDYASGKR